MFIILFKFFEGFLVIVLFLLSDCFLNSFFQTKNKIIRTNLKAINVNKFDLEFEVSSLYALLLCTFFLLLLALNEFGVFK